MKTLNFRTVGAIAAASMIALSGVGLRVASVFAQSGTPPAASAPAIEDTATGPDTDTIDEQVDDQTATDGVVDAPEVKGVDTDTVNEQVGDQNAPDNTPETPEAVN